MRSSLTRREMLRLSAAAVCGLGLLPRLLRAQAAQTAGDFTFLAVNDLHFSDAACRPWFDQVVKQMKRSAPKAEFCLLGGDLADEGTTVQLTGIRDAFRRLKIPIYSVVGNHDYRSDSDRSAYELIFPRQINYSFEHRGWQVIALDTSEGTRSQGTTISDTTLHWFDQKLPELDPLKPTILVTHFPLGRFVFGRPLNADALLQRCTGLNLQAIFSGHYHAFTERHFGDAVLTTDRCCSRVRENHDGTPEKGWFVCQAAHGQITRTFVEFKFLG